MKVIFQRQFAFAVVFVLIFPLLLRASDDHAVLVADATSQVTQNSRADDEHLSRMTDRAMLRRFVQHGYLVNVPASTSTYYLQSVPRDYQYCRPWTKQFLTRISRQFYAKFGEPLRVTSLVRTEQRQRALTRVNGNAADADGPTRSSHLTGATIDISKRFMSDAEIAWTRAVLYSLREQGYLYAIEEFYQPTFHVMVYRNYTGYVKNLRRHRGIKRARIEHPTTDTETADANTASADVGQQ